MVLVDDSGKELSWLLLCSNSGTGVRRCIGEQFRVPDPLETGRAVGPGKLDELSTTDRGSTIRSLVISCKLLGTREWFVIHHTDCGMEAFIDETMREMHREDPAAAEVHYMSFLTIRDQEQSVMHDVQRIRAHPLIPRDIPIYGFIYDVKSGRLIEVPEATRAGAAS